MADARVELQEQLAGLLRASTPEDRATASKALHAAVVRFLVSPAPETPDGRAASARDQAFLAPRDAILAGMNAADLETFNRLLPWAAATADLRGRAVGAAWSASKRADLQPLQDKRHLAFNATYPLEGRRVLEVGCFEGIHTLSLLSLGAQVIAAEGRVENVLKTLARLWIYDQSTPVLLWDLERPAPAYAPADWDVLHHVGVLYHLSDPVGHLAEVLPRTGSAVLLDTHVADPSLAQDRYEAGPQIFRVQRAAERISSPFAGLADHAKWLLLEDLLNLLADMGFADVRLVEDRAERNGRRVTIWAFRDAVQAS